METFKGLFILFSILAGLFGLFSAGIKKPWAFYAINIGANIFLALFIACLIIDIIHIDIIPSTFFIIFPFIILAIVRISVNNATKDDYIKIESINEKRFFILLHISTLLLFVVDLFFLK